VVPTSLELPRVLEGEPLKLEGEVIQMVDLEMIETIKATALYVPSAKMLVSADLVYSKLNATTTCLM
jgi:glyoxylase-like metal-dependent hydrolase (beta-lactamase superfamily II)